MLFSVLDRYVSKHVLITILIVGTVLVMITALITFVDQMRYIGRGDVDFTFLMAHIMMQVPSMIVMLFPVIVLLSGVIALGNLARSSELIVLQGLGLSKAGIIMIALKIVFPLILIVIAIGEFVVPPLEQYAENRLNQTSSRGQLSITHRGLWLREGNDFISIRFTLSDGTIQDIARYEFQGQELIAMSMAKRGRYNGRTWEMRDIVRYSFDERAITTSKYSKLNWPLALNPERIEVVGVKGMYLTFKGLMDYIGYLEENNQESDKYRLELYGKIAMPFSMVVMMLLAASTVFGPLRTMSMGMRVVSGMALGFLFYISSSIGSPFALVYGLPPSLGASLPTLVFFLLAMWLLNRRA